jgi:hypothetical protein
MEEPFFHSNPKLAPSYYDTAPRPKRFSRPVAEALEANITITSTILVRRALCLSVGMFDEALRQAEDYHLWIKLAAIADFVFVPEVVMHYRQHSANTTKTDAPRTWTIKAFEALLGRAEFAPYRPLIRRRLQRFHIENARFHRNGGMSRKAFGDAWGAVRLNPFSAAWKEVAAAFVEGLKR